MMANRMIVDERRQYGDSKDLKNLPGKSGIGRRASEYPTAQTRLVKTLKVKCYSEHQFFVL